MVTGPRIWRGTHYARMGYSISKTNLGDFCLRLFKLLI
uniref:Uncharacterized protein n=1 Tax=Arundo donax TaxID=35708 RepID=A0A0A9EA77_ARUDO